MRMGRWEWSSWMGVCCLPAVGVEVDGASAEGEGEGLEALGGESVVVIVEGFSVVGAAAAEVAVVEVGFVFSSTLRFCMAAVGVSGEVAMVSVLVESTGLETSVELSRELMAAT